MKKKSYSELLKSPKWQKKRLEIMKRDKFKCKLCGDTETQLQIHHKEYISGCDPWEYDNSNLVTLCQHCHNEVTGLKNLRPNLDFSKIKIYKCDSWQDGDRIMFVSYCDIVNMMIYDKNNIPTVGFCFNDSLAAHRIISIFKNITL